MTLIMLLSLIGLPNREVEPLARFPGWVIKTSVGRDKRIESIRLTKNDVSHTQWDELRNAMSDAGLRKQSESVNNVKNTWFVQEDRVGAGLKSNIIYIMNDSDTASISVLIEGCSKCTA